MDRFQQRVGEQIGAVPVPQIWELLGEAVQLSPLERVQSRTPEQTTEFPVPQIMEERVQNHTQEQIMDFPVPQNMEDYVGVVCATPQELVQNRSFVRQTMKEIGDGVQHVPSKRMPERHGDRNIKGLDKYNMPCAGVVPDMIPTGFVRVADVFSVMKDIGVKKGPKRVFVDSGLPHSASKPFTGKVFTVEMPHQHVHQAYPGDSVVFNIKGLDKYNLPRSGDVMVPAHHMEEPVPQIAEEIVERPLPSVMRP